MRKRFLYTIAFLYISIQIIAQIPQGIQYQVIVRAEDNSPVLSQQVTLNVEILQGSITGSVVFSETHELTTTNNGTAIFTIGSLENGVGSLNNISWGDHEYFLQVKADSRILSTDRVLVAPFVKYVNTANSVNRLSYDQLSNVPDLSNFDEDVSDDFSGDYNDLDNLPSSYFDGDYNSLTGSLPTQYITQEESDKIDSLTITKDINFQNLETKNIASKTLVGTPEFGTAAGAVVEGNTAWKAVDANMIHTGSVGINVPVPSDFGGAGIMVNGAVLYDGIPVSTTPGMLFYDPLVNDGAFCYYKENGEIETLGTGVIEGGGTHNNGYQVILDDLIFDKSLVIGKGASIDHNVGDYTMVIVGNIILIKFDDTSTTGSFPYNDWQIKTNDMEAGGENYFAFVDATANTIPFRVDAGAVNDAIYIADNGNTGFGTNTPTEKLDVQGNIQAMAYIGDATQLTGIDVTGTGSVENSGSTTIAADDNADSKGQIEFFTKGTESAVIANNGNVGIGATPLNAKLEVADTAAFQDLIVTGNMYPKSVSYPVHKEDITSTGLLYYDVTDKSVIILNPTAGTISLYLFLGTVIRKEIVIVNEHASNKINSNNVAIPGGGDFSLGQYESATLLYTSSGWVATDLVQTP
ncbi:MAG: hypothetical protein JEZ09_19570 [Salinivirgaceae bacterium]|nr:hypothetical protein [Salinivirgaceae bacterium]